MSSNRRSSAGLEAWLVLFFMAVASLWYASHQLVNSLYFTYQVARILVPGLVPDVNLR